MGAQDKGAVGSGKSNRDLLEEIYTWMREPDWTEEATVEWLMDWVNRRPIAQAGMLAMLMPDDPQATESQS